MGQQMSVRVADDLRCPAPTCGVGRGDGSEVRGSQQWCRGQWGLQGAGLTALEADPSETWAWWKGR